MDLLARYDRAADDTSTVIFRVDSDQLSMPTPCTEWTVRQIINHLSSGLLNAAARCRGEEIPYPDADRDDPEPQAGYAVSVAALGEAFGEPGVLDKIVWTPFGDQPASMVVHLRVAELLVHGWDIARATGQPTDFASELAERALAEWRDRLGDDPRPADSPIGPAQSPPADASPLDRLAAYFGRVVT
jgi:uncharacterized protein (TIGR03086 family)